MPKFEKFDPVDQKEKQSAKTEKKNTAPEKLDKNEKADQVTELYRDIIKNNKNGLYSCKMPNWAVYDVTIQWNNLVLHKFHKWDITKILKCELDKEAFTITIDGLGTWRYNRIEKTYSGSEAGIKAAEQKINECKKYIKMAIDQKRDKEDLSSLEKELDNSYA